MGFDEWAKKYGSNTPGLGIWWTTGDMEQAFSGGHDEGYKAGMLAAADMVVTDGEKTLNGIIQRNCADKINRKANGETNE